jgi:hypothetical protein
MSQLEDLLDVPAVILQRDPADKHVDEWPNGLGNTLDREFPARREVPKARGVVSCVCSQEQSPGKLVDAGSGCLGLGADGVKIRVVGIL